MKAQPAFLLEDSVSGQCTRKKKKKEFVLELGLCKLCKRQWLDKSGPCCWYLPLETSNSAGLFGVQWPCCTPVHYQVRIFEKMTNVEAREPNNLRQIHQSLASKKGHYGNRSWGQGLCWLLLVWAMERQLCFFYLRCQESFLDAFGGELERGE